MAQQSDDVSTTFSTLNVNAMEFVPSFCSPPNAADSTTSEPSAAATEKTDSPQKSPTKEAAPDEPTSGSSNEENIAVIADILNDKTPENPGDFTIE